MGIFVLGFEGDGLDQCWFDEVGWMGKVQLICEVWRAGCVSSCRLWMGAI